MSLDYNWKACLLHHMDFLMRALHIAVKSDGKIGIDGEAVVLDLAGRVPTS